jgi:hypothetical protein
MIMHHALCMFVVPRTAMANGQCHFMSIYKISVPSCYNTVADEATKAQDRLD